jgi:hypothetical protein
MGQATTENWHGLAVASRVAHANGTAERRASETKLKVRRKAAGRRITAGEDKAYDTADHVANLRAIGVTQKRANTIEEAREKIDAAVKVVDVANRIGVHGGQR